MRYFVYDPEGCLLYEGYSWPIARAALDFAVMQDKGCPELVVKPELEKQNL